MIQKTSGFRVATPKPAGLADTVRVVVVRAVRGFLDARGFDLASGLAYSSLLSFVPLVASVTVLAATFFGDTGVGLYRIIRATVPGATGELLSELQTFARRAQALSGFSSLFFLLSSLRMFFLVEGAANALWGTTRSRPALRKVGLALVVVLLGPIAIGVLNSLLLESGASFTEFRTSGFLLSALVLALLYRSVPSSHVRWGPALGAGLFAGLSLTALRVLFTRGIFALRGVGAVYGPASVAVAFVLAIGLVWAVLLLGVSLAHALQFRGELLQHDEPEKESKQRRPLDEAVHVLLFLAGRFRSGDGRATLAELTAFLGLTEPETRSRLKRLAASELVLALPDGVYRLARLPETISLYAVARAVGDAAPRPLPGGDDATAESLRRLYRRAAREERHVLQGISLRDLEEGREAGATAAE